MHQKILRFLFLILLITSVQFLHAQTIVRNGTTIFLEKKNKAIANTTESRQLYLKFAAPPQKKALAEKGIFLQEYVGSGAFNAIVRANVDLKRGDFTHWMQVNPLDKINPYLLSDTNRNLRVFVSLSKEATQVDLDKVLSLVGGIKETEQPFAWQNKWIVVIPKNRLLPLADLTQVLYLDPKFDDVLLNNSARNISFTGILQNEGGMNILGDSITIGVGDDTPPVHIDLWEKAKNFNPFLRTHHGIHTAGTVASMGIANEYFKGFAPKANLVTDFFSNIIAKAPEYEQDFGMKATNNSYAALVNNCNYAGVYDATSQFVDELSRTNPQLINIFAAGNDGGNHCAPYPQGFATVVGSFQSSKNALVVGMIGKNDDIINPFTARGPVKDGRLKPEIIAVGNLLASCYFDNTYVADNGTSMAAPNVTGAAGLLQQRYKQLNGGLYPDNALIKALLMNGAMDLGNPGPDYSWGFGRMNVGKSAEMLNNQQFFSNTVAHLGQQNLSINIPANIAQAKIMLYWNDAPAAPNNAKALVNDLDLHVVSPNSSIHFPLVLNPDSTHVNELAIEGADHLNNVEQVVLNNPTAGSYTVNVTGFYVPEGAQKYYVVYSFLPQAIDFHFPTINSKVETGSDIYIYWYAPQTNNNFTIEFSSDNGATWTTQGTALSDKRYFTWTPPSGVNSSVCRLRITSGSLSKISESFTLTGRPAAVLNNDQCPGSIHISWSSIPNVTYYHLFKKIGREMMLVDSTTSLNYNFTGLSSDSTYWVAVAASANGRSGYRSVGIAHQPNAGNCNNVADGDLAITRLLSPKSGRQFTQSALSSSETLVFEVRNQDNQVASNYSFSYSINNGAWTASTNTIAIPAAATAQISVPNINLSTVGNYLIEAAIHNLATNDPVKNNDTLRTIIKYVANLPLNLNTAFEENFENNQVTSSVKPIFAIPGIERFDYENSSRQGRIRSFVQSQTTISGQKSVSLDAIINQKNDIPNSPYNRVIGTFNLANYNLANNELRFDLDYILHGIPKFDTANKIMLRGTDTDPWLLVKYFDTNAIGMITNSGSLSLNNVLAANNQSFSTATQIMIQQRDTSLISSINFGNGLTFDNLKLYSVIDDIALVSHNPINKFNCGIGSLPLTVQVANLVSNTINNISISYKIDQHPIVTETISQIAGRDTIDFTFTQPMNLSAPGEHLVTVWVHYPTDNYRVNDTIINIEIHNQPLIAQYPYLEGFEDHNGYFFADGKNNSWAHGTPNGLSLNHAANGAKVWKTSLTGAYNSNELSYLYGPCFDLTGLSNPTLSFSAFYEIEEPSGGTIFDKAYVEYSTDAGQTWQVLGMQGQGYNWYNLPENIWTGTAQNYWHVATIPLPQVAQISIRWVLESDPGAEFGGLAIDDVHVYDLKKTIFDNDSFSPAPTAHIAATTEFGTAQEISAIINPLNQNLGTTIFQTYKHTNFLSPDSQQYFLPRNFVLKAQNTISDSIELKLFVKDSMALVLRNANNCMSCSSQPEEIYSLGVTTYTDSIASVLNNNLQDDSSGTFTYLTHDQIWWVPYADGYYAHFRTDQIGEYWFNDGGITGKNPLPQNTLTFTAVKEPNFRARLNWSSSIDTSLLQYSVQRAGTDGVFQNIFTTYAVHQNNHVYECIDTPVFDAPYVFYRIKYTKLSGGNFYSVVRKLAWDDIPTQFAVYPNPVTDGNINIKWMNPKDHGFNWTIYNSVGQKIKAGWIDQATFSSSTVISLRELGLAAGLYILKINGQSNHQEYKIIYQPH